MKGGSWRWPTSWTRCAAASRSDWCRRVRKIRLRCGARRRAWLRFWWRRSSNISSTIWRAGELREFLLDRIKYYFREIRGFKYDEVNAVLASGCGTLTDVEARLTALAAVRPTEDFEPLAASFKRIQNILKQAEFEPKDVLDAGVAGGRPGTRSLRRLCARARCRPGESYRRALEQIASLRPRVDTFFDKVLVNAKVERVRNNRLTLLHNLLTEFSTIADFSEIVTSGEQNNIMKNYVYSFGGGTADGDGKMKDVLGGKGAGLAEMSRAGVPVPPGFTISTEVCNIYFENNNSVPAEINQQVLAALAKLEAQIGKKLGDPKNPLLVSVRSGARFSMPGMMNTILNLGLNDATTEGLATLSGNPRFAYDSYRRFIQMFGEVALDIDMEKFDHIFDTRKHKAKVKLDTDLSAKDLQGHHRRLQEAGPEGNQEAVSAGRARAVGHVARRGVPLLVESEGRLLSQDGKDSGRDRHRRQRAGHGVRQSRRYVGYGRRFHARSRYRRERFSTASSW